MSIVIDIQYATDLNGLPKKKQIKNWVTRALKNHAREAEITIRIVDESEGKQLNEKWRKTTGATNVLSFPYNEANENNNIQGDIILCAPVIIREATEQGKTTESHWAHMIVHGTLHLLGYDHINKADAEKMETLEIKILKKLDIPDPYLSR